MKRGLKYILRDFHLVCHVPHRLSFDHLDPLYLLVNLLHKVICRQHPIDTAVLKRIEIPPCIKRIERTNKDDNGRIQAVIVRARREQVSITSLLLFYEFLR